ncbi:hypothetical protein JVU11DRAFT_12719 [Chiua virens]|nr:hypothetical protein JVU11DRAFT_12719 [Chiua virens]
MFERIVDVTTSILGKPLAVVAKHSRTDDEQENSGPQSSSKRRKPGKSWIVSSFLVSPTNLELCSLSLKMMLLAYLCSHRRGMQPSSETDHYYVSLG